MLITRNLEAKLTVIDMENFSAKEETLALLKTFALSYHGIEQGKFFDIEGEFTELD